MVTSKFQCPPDANCPCEEDIEEGCDAPPIGSSEELPRLSVIAAILSLSLMVVLRTSTRHD